MSRMRARRSRGRQATRIPGRIQPGDPVDLEAIDRHDPRRIASLRPLLPAIEMMVDLGRSLSRDAARAESVAGGRDDLGEFRIAREIGRGGWPTTCGGPSTTGQSGPLTRRVAPRTMGAGPPGHRVDVLAPDTRRKESSDVPA
jgi:hypothetical protein